MTTPPDQTAAINLSEATAIMLADGVWHDLAGSLGMVMAPAFADPLSTDPVTGGPRIISPGDTWVQFVDVTTGQAYAAPLRSVMAVRIAGPVAAELLPHLVRSVIRHAPQHAHLFGLTAEQVGEIGA